MPNVLYEKDGRIARIILNRAEVMNVIDLEMPQVIEEAELSDEQKKSFSGAAKAFATAAGGTPVMGQGTRRNINFEPVQDQPGRVKISGSNLTPKIFDQTSFNNNINAAKARYPTTFAYKLASAWAPKQDEEKEGGEKSKETPSEPEATQELPGFTQTQRDGIAEYIEQKDDKDPTLAQRAVQKIQSTIISPLSRTKLATLMKERPDLIPKIQSQLLDLTSRFFSMAGKVERAKLADGTEVTFIRGERLSAGDRAAGRAITVRGNDGTGGVSFGRANGETIEEYKEIQTYARAYDHKTYGFKLGTGVSKYGPNIHDARILPEGVDITSMTKDEFDQLDTAVRKSISSSSVSAPIDDNDTVGKLFEDIIQIGGAIRSGDAKDKTAALKEMRTRLEKLKELGNVDLVNFAAPLLSGEVDDIEALLGNAPNLGAAVKSKIQLMDRQLAVMERVIGLKSVKKSERPSQGSKIGFRTDNRYIISNDDPLNSEYADLMNPNEEGDYRLEISAKQINSPTATTSLGSNRVGNALGKDTAEYDKLHAEHLERAVGSGGITEEQAQSCRDALEHDRKVYGDLVKMFGDLTKPNKQALANYYNTLIKEAPGQFTDTKSQLKYVNYLKGLQSDLKDKEVNPRQAAMKLLQLHRMRKAGADRDYAAGMFYNDAILSMGSFENELLMRGSPVDVALIKTHDLANRYARAVFSDNYDVEVGLASVSLKTKQGNLVSSNRVAGKENKQFVEHNLANFGKNLFGQVYPV